MLNLINDPKFDNEPTKLILQIKNWDSNYPKLAHEKDVTSLSSHLLRNRINVWSVLLIRRADSYWRFKEKNEHNYYHLKYLIT